MYLYILSKNIFDMEFIIIICISIVTNAIGRFWKFSAKVGCSLAQATP